MAKAALTPSCRRQSRRIEWLAVAIWHTGLGGRSRCCTVWPSTLEGPRWPIPTSCWWVGDSWIAGMVLEAGHAFGALQRLAGDAIMGIE